MPPKYVKNRKPKYTRNTRRRPKKMFRRRKATTLKNNGQSPISTRYLTTLKYADTFTLSSTSGFTTSHVFRMNSIFDPDFTGTGHQPYGRDTLDSLYSRYRVYKLGYKITASPTVNQSGCLAVLPVNDATSFNTVDRGYVMEFPNTKTKQLQLDQPTIISGSINLPKMNGSLSSVYKTDDRFQSLMTGNPAEVMHLNVIAWGNGGTSATVTCNVELYYYCEFFDPKPIAQS